MRKMKTKKKDHGGALYIVSSLAELVTTHSIMGRTITTNQLGPGLFNVCCITDRYVNKEVENYYGEVFSGGKTIMYKIPKTPKQVESNFFGLELYG